MKSTHHNRGDRRGPGRWPVVAAAVPVIMMAGAWSAAVAQTTGGDDAVAAGQNLSVPDVPSAESSTPLVVTTPTTTPPGAAKVTPVGSTSTQDVPAASLAAYKRASTVLAASDAACRLPWNLVAAIGKIESDHGRYGGNVVGVDGVSRPGVLGIALDGTNNTARILDSDAGALDRDTTYDRAVGPMQFIPSTWSAVAVDGNGDGVKNPQDINDAAVSAGVYLCAGGGDLSTPAGARSAVLRYNQSGPYVDSVLALSARYAAGDFSQAPATTSVPTDTTPAAPVTPVTPAEVTTPGKGVNEVAAAALLPHPTVVTPAAPYEPAAPQPTTPTTPTAPAPPTSTPTPTPAPTTPATTPAPTPTPTQPTRTPSATPTPSPKPTPTPTPSATPSPTPSATPSPTPSPSATPTAEECDGVTVTGSTETAGSPADGTCVPPCEDGTEPDADVETPCAIVTKP